MALGILISLGLAKVGIIVAAAKIFRRKKRVKLQEKPPQAEEAIVAMRSIFSEQNKS